MSTRCCIAVEHCNGTVSEIYCHSDGYLSGVGETLLQFYNTTALVSNLVKLGDISSLGDHAKSSDTIAYMRDRRDPDCPARTHANTEAFCAYFDIDVNRQSYGYEYMYLLTRKQGWLVKQYGDDWELLTPALITEKMLNE